MTIKSALAQLIPLHKEVMRRVQRGLGFSKTAALVRQRIPSVVDNLVARRIIAAEDKQACATALQDHAKCLLLLEKVAESVRRSDLGVPMAGVNVPPGSRKSDQIWVQRLLNG